MNTKTPTELRRLFLALILALNFCTAIMLLASGPIADVFYGRELRTRFEVLQRLKPAEGWSLEEWEGAAAVIARIPDSRLPVEWRSYTDSLRRFAGAKMAYEAAHVRWKKCQADLAGRWCAMLMALTFFVTVVADRFLFPASDPLEADWLDLSVIQRSAFGIMWMLHGLTQPTYSHHLMLGLGFSLLFVRFYKVASEH